MKIQMETVDKEKHVIDHIDTPIGKEMVKLLLSKTGPALAKLIGKSTLEEFIDYRCEVYLEEIGEGYQSNAFLEGKVGHTGVAERARSKAFEGLS